MFNWKTNCLWRVAQIINDQQDVTLISARVDRKGRVIRYDPFHRAATKRMVLFAYIDHVADRVEE